MVKEGSKAAGTSARPHHAARSRHVGGAPASSAATCSATAALPDRLRTRTKQAAIVDPGGDVPKLLAAIKELGVTPVAIWLTHGHLDHAGGAAELAEALSIPVIGPHEGDRSLLDGLPEQGLRFDIRGLRAVSDFEYEFQLAQMNRQLAPEIETFFIVTDAKYSYLSSRGIKDAFQFGGAIKDMVPPGVFRRLRERIPPRNV